ncbi:MAG: lipid-A-disaccharide synthase N-terminal domain-containing protein [Alistipes sp.]|nr:lipid-A-disaccharide synthase N-terminal domain-containing protein [Alistipes sp.]MDE7070199.1 lipid-A-disaccharide synthase N-terminal domain-containing protein [Alistipes sp.]
MSWWIYAIGFLAQAFFSARILVQWILSERAKQVVSPAAYWVCSLAGSYLLFVYGWLRDDFAIILGQSVSYYIYLWNLNAKGVWRRMPSLLRLLLLFTPLVIGGGIARNAAAFFSTFLANDEVPLWLLLFGSAGQLIFSLRFVYQWFCSVRRHESVLPAGFWILSLLGSGMIVLYGVVRHDPVLILGQSVGFVAYARNLFIGKKFHDAKE